ncbi:MAG: radical SAM protein [Chloroflexi bacterium]|nr:radical SAM protein [Chloroflexota bacterium]
MAYREIAFVREPLRKALTLLSIVAPVRPLVGPARVTVEASTRCNFRCLMCPHYSPLVDKGERAKTDFIDVDLAGRVFVSAAQMGAKIVSFSGRGEPLLHPDFAHIVRRARSCNLQTEVFTNGSLLTESRIEELIDARLTTLGVSLVGASPEGYARYHPGTTSDRFQSVVESLSLLKRLKERAGVRQPMLDLRFIAMSGSHLDVEKMVDLGIQVGADRLGLMPLRNRSSGEIGSLALSYDEENLAVERLRHLTPRVARLGLKTNVDELIVFHKFGATSHEFPCYAAWFDTRVLVDGTVEFCVRCHRPLGNVNECSLKEIWLDPEYEILRNVARNASERSRLGECDCNRCCHFYSNWRITAFLSKFGFASQIKDAGNGRSKSMLAGGNG